MSFFIVTGKIFASIFLIALFLTGIIKANPRFHSPAYPPLAEYGTGLILTFSSVAGFYYLWW